MLLRLIDRAAMELVSPTNNRSIEANVLKTGKGKVRGQMANRVEREAQEVDKLFQAANTARINLQTSMNLKYHPRSCECYGCGLMRAVVNFALYRGWENTREIREGEAKAELQCFTELKKAMHNSRRTEAGDVEDDAYREVAAQLLRGASAPAEPPANERLKDLETRISEANWFSNTLEDLIKSDEHLLNVVRNHNIELQKLLAAAASATPAPSTANNGDYCGRCGKLVLRPNVNYGINPDAVCKCAGTP